MDDNALKPILQSLYFEHGSPYNFGVLPVEILGTVYERFLGKVIRLTAGHQAKVEKKPEVRKSGGVYYTPAYIVNYIINNTIGKQIEGKSPADLAGGKTTPPFRVLDMACGSGSFLLGAYQILLDHCLKWYQTNLPKNTPKPFIRTSKVKPAHHRRTQTHSHHPHLRCRYRPAGRRNHQALFAAESSRRRKRHHPLPADDPLPRTCIAESIPKHQMRELPYRLRLLHDS